MKKIVTRLFIVAVLCVISISAYASQFSSFAPMEDARFTFRIPHSGVDIDHIKPYRETLEMDENISEGSSKFSFAAFDFTTFDIIIFSVLLGGYIMLTRKKTNSRNAGF